MNLDTLQLFVPACFALNLAPGPSNLLALNHGTRYGCRSAVLAGFGRLAAFSGMLALAVVGLAGVLQASEALFLAVKLLGAGYLVYLACQLWRLPPREPGEPAPGGQGLLGLARREFMLAAGNPKAIVIFTAFLPQFVHAGAPVLPQLALLGGLFLVLEWLAIAAYAVLGARLAHWLRRPASQRLFSRACAGLLGWAALVLLLSRRHT
ncbi:LysE family translocator [Spiribacter halobius]|uniref:Lysine transporter LysE n=1 Tax=Sediminicurvatus halobius TaxID=2182432 RepID=A0A2U2N6W0_9GAMM|nr:LysE family translocator [Spiribacter halobius]PWG64945.1 lysine transporter LysE [Spiribacter halobius]UEX78199.1 LysE family translocator [Spiribacter halobius]